MFQFYNSRIRNAIGIVLVTVLTSSKVRSVRTKLFIVNWKLSFINGIARKFYIPSIKRFKLKVAFNVKEKNIPSPTMKTC